MNAINNSGQSDDKSLGAEWNNSDHSDQIDKLHADAKELEALKKKMNQKVEELKGKMQLAKDLNDALAILADMGNILNDGVGMGAFGIKLASDMTSALNEVSRIYKELSGLKEFSKEQIADLQKFASIIKDLHNIASESGTNHIMDGETAKEFKKSIEDFAGCYKDDDPNGPGSANLLTGKPNIFALAHFFKKQGLGQGTDITQDQTRLNKKEQDGLQSMASMLNGQQTARNTQGKAKTTIDQAFLSMLKMAYSTVIGLDKNANSKARV